MHDQGHDIEHYGDRRPMTAGRASAAIAAALLLAAVTNAQVLERVAERQGYGRGRDIALDITKPVAWVSHHLFLDRPREWLASATGHSDPPRSSVFGGRRHPPPAISHTARSAPTTTSTTTRVTTPRTTTTFVPPTTIPGPPRRTPTADAPLRLWSGGDSLMGTMSEQLSALVSYDRRVTVHTDVQVATGLARPDVLDWPTELENQIAQYDPEVLVMSYGANDDQPLHPTPDTEVALFTPEWEAEYQRRVGIMMDIASQGGLRTVIWLGLPAERPENLDGAKEAMNAAARAEAAKRPAVAYLPLGPLLAGPDGGYADQLQRADGSVITARLPDGVHVTEDGAALIAPTILEAFVHEFHLR